MFYELTHVGKGAPKQSLINTQQLVSISELKYFPREQKSYFELCMTIGYYYITAEERDKLILVLTGTKINEPIKTRTDPYN